MAVINGEKAAFNTPIFSQKRERTLDMLIRDMYAEVMTEHRGVRSSIDSSFTSGEGMISTIDCNDIIMIYRVYREEL